MKEMIDKLRKCLFSCRIKENKRILRFLFLKFTLPYKNYMDSKAYGRIYFPHYNAGLKISADKPCIYNEEGVAMDTYFIRDAHFSVSPYHPEVSSKYFLWDRYNIGLDTHFYTHGSMLETMGSPSKRYGLLAEAERIVPADYKMFDRHKGLHEDFDLIFTHSERLLDTLPNARFFPFFASPWYGGVHGGTIRENGYELKTKNVSILSSAKRMCHLHDVRIAAAEKCKREGLADTFGTFDGGPLIKNGMTLENYRYSIVMENDLSPLFFTQKITSCFAAQTIPIYLGTPKIGEFFNADGIIQISENDIDKLDGILRGCNEKDYFLRLPAIKENFRKVKEYVGIFDWLYEKYLVKPDKNG